MDYRLDHSYQNYIKIAVKGNLEKDILLKAMSQLFTHPDYCRKNSLWDLRQASQGSINILVLTEIVGFLRLYRPKTEFFANKVAILVSTDMNKALVNVYITLSRLLPFKFKVFTDQSDVELFLT